MAYTLPGKPSASFRDRDANVTFYRSLDAAKAALDWPTRPGGDGFPILLVLSDINSRELDDFRCERVVDGKPQFEGSRGPEGRHVPGAESGGARAVYLADEGRGMGLVSADGWRVPYLGSDCVVYHEGVGHPIGLPHPEPIDESVMGTAQYRFWLNQTWINQSQKEALGWRPPDPNRLLRPDLFTTLTALNAPATPRAGQPVALTLHWPDGIKLKSLQVAIQTELPGAWDELPTKPDGPPDRVDLGTFDGPTPVSYRVRAEAEDGQRVELWGYFQVE